MRDLVAVRDLAFLVFHSGENGTHGVTLVSPADGKRFAVKTGAVLEVLSGAVRPVERAELSRTLEQRLGLTPDDAGHVLAQLVEHGVLESVEDGADGRMEMWHHYNWEVAGLYHFMSRGIRFADVDGAGKPPMEVREEVVQGYRRDGSFPYHDLAEGATDDPGAMVALPRGEADLDWPLGPTLLRRRTLRTWTQRRISLQGLGNLLWYGLRPIGENRAVIAADTAFHRLDSLMTHFAHLGVWVLPVRVDGLPDDVVYRYDPVEHRLVRRGNFAGARSLEALCVGQVPLRDASVVVVLSAFFDEIMWRYRHNRAYGVLWLEIGQMMQNLILSATGMRLRPFITPALLDSSLDELLGLDGYREGALYLSAYG